ncbi:MAG: TolC family protein [Celeribacter marinus]
MRYIVLTLILAACAPISPASHTDTRDVEIIGTPFARAVLTAPEVKSARFAVRAAQRDLDAVAARRSVQVGASLGAGGERTTTDTDAGAVVNASASKVLSDGGRFDAQIDGATLQVEGAVLAHALAADDVLFRLVSAAIQARGADRSIAQIDRALSQYGAREDLITSAYASGIVTNSTMFDIEAALSEARQNRLDFTLQRDLARAELDQYLTVSGAHSDLYARLREGDVARAPAWRIRAVELQADLIETDRRAVMSNKKPQTNLVATVSNADDTPSVYFGVKVDLNVYDGGATDAGAAALAARYVSQREQAEALRDALRKNTELARITAQKGAQRRGLLLERKAQSERRLAEMEKLLRIGRADVGTIAREVIAQAETAIALIGIDTQRQMATLNLLQSKGGVCDVVAMCDALWNVE